MNKRSFLKTLFKAAVACPLIVKLELSALAEKIVPKTPTMIDMSWHYESQLGTFCIPLQEFLKDQRKAGKLL